MPSDPNDIIVDARYFETIPERQYKILRVYRSVIQHDDPDQIQLAMEMISSLGFSIKLANDCFILHLDDLYFKEALETAWRVVKPGNISTISQDVLDTADDDTLSMTVQASNEEELIEMDAEKENGVFSLGPISFPPLFDAIDDDSFPLPSPPKGNCAIMYDTTNEEIYCDETDQEQMLNDTIKSLDISGDDSFDWEAPTKATDIFNDVASNGIAGMSLSQ